ncbi:trans-sulfuration enzyme family protein [Sphingomonas jaspsi]|uniref:trans-sulfuration enzyme family protein n=1 Tax=Sphingomonas jaspsi TaxID=392409 RepID=UPI0004B096D8|nr:PLP-dependent transferase [Sphingomonas jaspsi]
MTGARPPATIVAAARPDLDPAYGSIVPPLWTSDTFRWDTPDDKPGFDYSRTVNPNRDLLAAALSELEGAAGGVITNSGQSAALLAILRLRHGAKVVAPHDCYGGTFRLLQGFAAKGQIDCRFVDLGDADALAQAMANGIDLLWIETPSNPLLRIVDIRRCVALAKTHGALVIADNTLPTPVRQRPLDLGCDFVMHSTTKAINGHSDLFGGALFARDVAHLEELNWWSNAAGLNGSAYDAAQILRGLRTLPLRVDRQEQSALTLARWLEAHPQVEAVHYPGLESHPGYAIAAAQQSGPGFMLSFRLKGGKPAADRFVASLGLITLASSLGGFASLICTPASMTHRGMPPEVQAEAGIHEDLLRLSVGLEDAVDLRSDLARGFAAALA